MVKDEVKIRFKDIDSYIASQPVEVRPTLEKLRYAIQKAVPKAEESISYNMPVFHYHGMLIYFASFKKHYSIFVRSAYLEAFKEELKNYKTSKATVNIPLEKSVPVQLISKIVKYAAKQNVEREKLKALKPRKKKVNKSYNVYRNIMVVGKVTLTR